MLFANNQQIIGHYLCFVALALAPIYSYLFRRHSRSLDLAQMLFAFYLAYSPTATIFSSYLNYSFLSFMSNFLNFCTTGDYVCLYGAILSPAVAWIGSVILVFLLIKILARCNKNFSFLKFYTFWKGLFRWFMAPLVYYSSGYLIVYLQSKPISSDKNILSCLIVLGFLAVWSFVQWIGYKIQENRQQRQWIKNVQFLSHWYISSIMVIIQLSINVNSIAKYFIYAPLLLYALTMLLKFKFTFNFFEKLFLLLTEGIIITLYSLYIFDYTNINSRDLDLIGLGLVIIMQILVFIPKFIVNCKKQGDQQPESEVHPNDRSILKMKKENSFQVAQVIPKNSYQNLNSPTSPQKNFSNRRR